jgi:hypothetical protein
LKEKSRSQVINLAEIPSRNCRRNWKPDCEKWTFERCFLTLGGSPESAPVNEKET